MRPGWEGHSPWAPGRGEGLQRGGSRRGPPVGLLPAASCLSSPNPGSKGKTCWFKMPTGKLVCLILAGRQIPISKEENPYIGSLRDWPTP